MLGQFRLEWISGQALFHGGRTCGPREHLDAAVGARADPDDKDQTNDDPDDIGNNVQEGIETEWNFPRVPTPSNHGFAKRQMSPKPVPSCSPLPQSGGRGEEEATLSGPASRGIWPPLPAARFRAPSVRAAPPGPGTPDNTFAHRPGGRG